MTTGKSRPKYRHRPKQYKRTMAKLKSHNKNNHKTPTKQQHTQNRQQQTNHQKLIKENHERQTLTTTKYLFEVTENVPEYNHKNQEVPR